MKTLNYALIGAGFIGKAHSHALKDMGLFFQTEIQPVMHTICDVEPHLEDVATRYGWMHFHRDWRTVIADPQIDVVIVATPGFTHKEIVCAAAEANCHILCEKPMTVSHQDAILMQQAVQGKKLTAMMGFNYRFIPAVRVIRNMIENNQLGRILGFTGQYFQDWAIDESFPYIWRMDAKNVGVGPLEVGSHIIDLARYLVGEFREVSGFVETFMKTRRDENNVENNVTTDDLSVFTTRFENGAIGVFQAGRVNCGHKNELSFTIHGSLGSVHFDLRRMNELQFCLREESVPDRVGYKTVSITESSHPYMSHWWASGHVIGWENLFVHMHAEFLNAIAGRPVDIPTFADGVQSHKIVQAVVDSSETHQNVFLTDVR